uniref:Uncharacterized protein n=1 Tax=Amphimedon queenslandica TaxID=400682 RepID=A0A1X7TQB7_AMPQE
HEHRWGYLTALKICAICKTSVAKPSRSILIKILCKGTVPNTEPVQWGRKQDRKALAAYMEVSHAKHDLLEESKCGLFISSVAPHVSAFADVIVLYMLWAWCVGNDFVSWTPVDTYIKRIFCDAKFVLVMVPNCMLSLVM